MKIGFINNENRNSILFEDEEIIETNGVASVVIGYAKTEDEAIIFLTENQADFVNMR